MSSFGVISSGFNVKTFADIKAAIEDAQKASLGAGINLSTTSVLSQINNPLIEELSQVWDALEAVYNGLDPDTAEGAQLEMICAIAPGIIRLPAVKAKVTLTLTLDSAVTVPAGSIVAVTANPDVRFITLTDVTSTTSGGYSVQAEAEFAQAITAAGSSITTIVTPVSGWTAVTNSLAADGGRNLETDIELRQRRVEELQLNGSGTVAAIRSAVRGVSTVTTALVYENPLDSTDGDGRPPHSFQAVVLSNPASGDEDEIAQAIFDNKPAGIYSYGAASGTATDEDGNDWTVNFSRVSKIRIYVHVDLTKDVGYGGDAAVKTAIQNYFSTLTVGRDVYASGLYASVFGVGGVLDVTSIKVDTISSPVADHVTIGVTEIAVIQSLSDITVTST